jgi:Uncharacterised nucleotidyltransferase
LNGRNGTKFSVEDRSLLILARGRLTAELRNEVEDLLARTVSWRRIVEQARVHGVLPLVLRNLKGLGYPRVPAEVRAELEVAAALNAARNAFFVRALTTVLGRFDAAGVPVIPLKGVALAESLYGDPTLRVCSDIDILVPRVAVADAFRLLIAEGLAPEEGELTPARMDLLLKSDIECAFVPRSGSVSWLLELHWDIAWRWLRNSVATDDIWAEARPQTVLGVEAQALSPEWEILYLIVHAARHRLRALKWLVDIHEACSARQVDWVRLRDKARRLGWEKVLQVTLSTCHALFDTPVPDDLSRRALPRWLKIFPESPVEAGLWQEALFATRLFNGTSAKLGYLGRLLFLPTIRERKLVSLPAPMRVLYYPLRPLRLAGRWITSNSRNHGG